MPRPKPRRLWAALTLDPVVYKRCFTGVPAKLRPDVMHLAGRACAWHRRAKTVPVTGVAPVRRNQSPRRYDVLAGIVFRFIANQLLRIADIPIPPGIV